MPGPTAFPQVAQYINTAAQSIATTAETVIATLTGINSRGSNFPIYLLGTCSFLVQAATTSNVLRLRLGGLAGAVIGAAQEVQGATAGDVQFASGVISATYVPSGEISGAVIVMTIQATAAGGNWSVYNAQLVAQQ